MKFYNKLIYLLYPEYIPPDTFIYPMKNKYSILIQLFLQNKNKKRLSIYHLLSYYEDKEIYYKLCKIQRLLSKFVTCVKYKRAKVYNELNLYGEKLKPNCIKILENNKIYKFDYFEMIKHIKKKIYYHEYFYVMSNVPTNPYTNCPFLLHNLYNIFFQLFRSDYLIPIGLRVYFNMNFDIDKFIDRHSYNIKLYILNEAYFTMPINEKYKIMQDMFIKLKKKIFLNISNEKLFDIFKHQVKEYFKVLHMPSWCSKVMLYQIKQNIQCYHKHYPNTGKKINTIFGETVVI